jgi:hypothetical protein
MTHADETFDMEYFHDSVLVSTVTAPRIEDSPDVIEVGGVRYRATSHSGPYEGESGRLAYHILVKLDDA